MSEPRWNFHKEYWYVFIDRVGRFDIWHDARDPSFCVVQDGGGVRDHDWYRLNADLNLEPFNEENGNDVHIPLPDMCAIYALLGKRGFLKEREHDE